MTTNHRIQPGDVFVATWGYDQTKVDFYLVDRCTKSSVYVTPIGHKTVSQGVIADPDNKLSWGNKRVNADSDADSEAWETECAVCGLGSVTHHTEQPHYPYHWHGDDGHKFEAAQDTEPRLKRITGTRADMNACFKIRHTHAFIWDGRPRYDTRAAGQPGH